MIEIALCRLKLVFLFSAPHILTNLVIVRKRTEMFVHGWVLHRARYAWKYSLNSNLAKGIFLRQLFQISNWFFTSSRLSIPLSEITFFFDSTSSCCNLRSSVYCDRNILHDTSNAFYCYSWRFCPLLVKKRSFSTAVIKAAECLKVKQCLFVECKLKKVYYWSKIHSRLHF